MNNESRTMSNRSKAEGNRSDKTRGLVLTALFTAIIIVMAFTPYLGYIPLGFMNATIIHVPVILGALFLGPKKGAFLGGVFGLTSMINNTMNPNLTSFVFSPFYSVGNVSGNFASVIVCMVPRIMIGVVAYYVFRLVCRLMKNARGSKTIGFAVAGVAGALTNTLLVMNSIYFLFGANYATAKGVATEALYGLILTIIGTYGIPEAIIAGILVTAIGKALSGLIRQN